MVFYQRHPIYKQQNDITAYSKSHQQQFYGEIRRYDKETEIAEIDVKFSLPKGSTKGTGLKTKKENENKKSIQNLSHSTFIIK